MVASTKLGGTYMEESTKEVLYYKYCGICKFKDVKADEDPCNECLATPYNTYSHKNDVIKLTVHPMSGSYVIQDKNYK